MGLQKAAASDDSGRDGTVASSSSASHSSGASVEKQTGTKASSSKDMENKSKADVGFGAATTFFPSSLPVVRDEEVKTEDVFCGRDREANSHVGNRRFRSLIRGNQRRYKDSNLREEKTRITSEIIDSIHAVGGRFLKRDEGTGMLHVVDTPSARDKVSHALRTARDPSRRRGPNKKATSTKHLLLLSKGRQRCTLSPSSVCIFGVPTLESSKVDLRILDSQAYSKLAATQSRIFKELMLQERRDKEARQLARQRARNKSNNDSLDKDPELAELPFHLYHKQQHEADGTALAQRESNTTPDEAMDGEDSWDEYDPILDEP